MTYRCLADAVLLLHLGFILFVALGGFLVWRRPRLAWLHLPLAAWGAAVEFGDYACPLTPLENQLRRLGGEAGYAGGFVERYLLPLVYPETLTREVQLVLGIGVVLINALAYAARPRRR